MYEEYVLERNGDLILIEETGFAIYRYINENQVYIVDIYVKPEHRKTGLASEMADKIAREAKRRGRNEMLGTVVPSAKGSHRSLLVLLAYGMTLLSASADLIVLRKEI